MREWRYLVTIFAHVINLIVTQLAIEFLFCLVLTEVLTKVVLPLLYV